MRLDAARLVSRPARELEGRERPQQLGMDTRDVRLDLRQQPIQVLSLQDLPAPALHLGCHPAFRTD